MSGREGGAASLAALRAFFFVHFAAFGVYLPFFPRWLEARGIEGLAMGLVLAIPPAVGVLAPPALGLVADALGVRGQLARLGSLGAMAAFAALAVLASVSPSPLPLAASLALAGLVLLHALARTPLFGVAEVLTLEALGGAEHRYGRVRVLGSLGFLLTSVSIGRLLDPSAPALVPALIAGGYGALLLVSFSLPRRAAPLQGVSLASLGLVRRHAAFFSTMALWQLGNAAYDALYSLHVRASGHSDAAAGALWALGVAFEVALMLAAPSLFARFSARPLLFVGLAAAGARWALIGQVRSLPALAALQPLHALSFAATWLAANAHLPRVAEGRLATAQGLLTAATASGSVLGMLLWSALFARHGAAVAFTGASFAALLVLVPAARALRRELAASAPP